VVTEE